MDADLDSLCTAVYVTADDLLPARAPNARPALNDAEVVTLALAQVVMGIPSDRRFLAAARIRLRHLLPRIPSQSAYLKRRNGLREAIDWLAGVFAAASPGFRDQVVLLDSTPVECGRSAETARRSALGDSAGYGWSRSHSRFFWGMRLHLCCAPDGTPRRAELVGADRKERAVALDLLPHVLRGGESVVCDKGYVGRGFERAVAELGGQVVRPARKDEPQGSRPRLARALAASDSASSRSFGPSRTSCRSSATAGAPPRACVPASERGSWPSQRASGSTTSSGDRAARSWPTWPEPVESII